MGTIKDIADLLEKTPAYKRLVTMQGEIDTLKQRVADLEAKLAPASGEVCPRCKERSFALKSSKPHAIFGDLGALEDSFSCSKCGHSENRMRNTG